MNLSKWHVDRYRTVVDGSFSPSQFDIFVGKNNSGKSNIINSLLDYKYIVKNGIKSKGWVEKRVTAREIHSSFAIFVEYDPCLEDQQMLLSSFLDSPYSPDSNLDQLLRYDWFSKIQHEIEVSENGRIESNLWADIDGRNIKVYEYSVTISGSINEYEITDFTQYPDLTFHSENLGLDDFQAEDADEGETVSFNHPLTSHDYPLFPEFLSDILLDYICRWESFSAFREATPQQDIQIADQLSSSGKNLSRVLVTLGLNDKDKLEEISSAFVDIMGSVSEVQARLVGANSDPKATVSIIEDGFDSGFSLEGISSGSQQILMLITKIVLASENTNLLLIEEPELHLHVGAQSKIFELILKTIEKNDDIQVVMSTHSKMFMGNVDQCNILTVSRDEETEIKSVEGAEINDHLVTMGYNLTDVLQSSGVLFVEGGSDKRIFEILSEKFGTGFKSSGIKVVSFKGSDFLEHGNKTTNLLDDAQIEYRFIIDSDGRNVNEKKKEFKDKIGGNPTHIEVLSDIEIESYLAKRPDAIAGLLQVDEEYVREFLRERTLDKGALSELWRDCESSYSEKRHGPLIARHIEDDNVPKELIEKIEWVSEELG